MSPALRTCDNLRHLATAGVAMLVACRSNLRSIHNAKNAATCCATRARDSCRFTMYTSWRPAALRDHGTYTMWREENRLQLKGSARQLWVLEPENFPPSLRASQGKRLWCCLCFQDYRFAFSAKDWSYCQNMKRIYLSLTGLGFVES